MEDFRTANDAAEKGSQAGIDAGKLLADSGFMEKESNALTGTRSAGKERKAGDAVEDHYIIVLKDKPLGAAKDSGNLVEDKIAKVMNRNGIRPTIGASQDTLIFKNAITGFATTLDAKQKQALQNDPDVAFVEQNKVVGIKPRNVTPTARNGGEYPTGVLRIEADKSPTHNTPGGVDVDIAILDTGINLRHSDLNVVENVSFIPGAATGDDDNGHGSHVGGSAAAKGDGKGVIGVAPGARLWAVKVLDSSGYGTMAQVIAGVDYVTKNADKIEVANMSLGDKEQSEAFNRAISQSVAAGVTHVVAAGNESDNAKDYSPANHPDVLTVSALADSDGNGGGLGSRTCDWERDDVLASFSNYGEKVGIAAPGACIESAWKASRSNTDTYASISGTSMASPHAAGAAGLVKARNPHFTPHQVYKHLIDNGKAQNDPNYGMKGDKDQFPEPILNVKGF